MNSLERRLRDVERKAPPPACNHERLPGVLVRYYEAEPEDEAEFAQLRDSPRDQGRLSKLQGTHNPNHHALWPGATRGHANKHSQYRRRLMPKITANSVLFDIPGSG